jgi:putative tryptophan/tyrosine transport system substrate-binding protein
VKRRAFLGVISGAAPVAARAQQTPAQQTPPVVGFLNTASPGPFSHLVAAFRSGLEETGFVEGRNVLLEFRWAEGRYDRLTALAAELIQCPVDVLATSSVVHPPPRFGGGER